MTRRLWLYAAVLCLFAIPALARRRAITPRAPNPCDSATLVNATYAQLLAADEQFVYFVDEMGGLARVPKHGGELQPLADPLDAWLPLAIAVDATHVYIGVLPIEALFLPLPGSILSVPKSGGVIGVLVSGVVSPFDLATDATHLYWASVGTFDFRNGSIAADGKIERVTHDGSTRETLVDDLSGPIGLALDDADVYFGESGIADGTSVGLFRVPKSGGAVVTIHDAVSAGPLVLDGNTLVLLGATETAGGVLAIEKDGASPMRALHSSDFLQNGIHVADRRAYFLQESDEAGGELASVSIDAPAGALVARTGIDGDDFLLDGCAAIVNTIDGDLVRIAR